MRLAQDGLEDARALADDVARLMYDMEVENLVLQDATEGLRTMDQEVLRLTQELHGVNRTLLGSRWEDILTDELKQQREFVRKMLEQGGETNKQLAAAGLFATSRDALALSLEAVEGVNAVLDSLDDRLLGPLRGDTQWRETLLAARSAPHLRAVVPAVWSAAPAGIGQHLLRSRPGLGAAGGGLPQPVVL